MNKPLDRKPLLVLYADGSIETPGATTYGELLARLNVIEQLAGRIRQQMLALPLPVAPDGDAQVAA